MTASVDHRRKELADFLKSRRMRFTPEEVGLQPDSQRRRTPGLRREEVAVLSGISLPWYTSLEQGRDIRVSEQILESLVRALKLNSDERNHLYSLAMQQVPLPANAMMSEPAPPEWQLIVDQLRPLPAIITDTSWKILGWNHMALEIFGDLGAMEEDDLNLLWLTFTNEEFIKKLVDWEPMAHSTMAQFRNAFGRNVGNPRFLSMIDRLRDASPVFAAWWEEHEVRSYPCGGGFLLKHPEVGLLEMRCSNMTMAENPNLVMTVLSPSPGTDALAKMDKLNAKYQ